MDEKKLRRLREKYGRSGARIHDERFRRVADSVSPRPGDRPKPYAGRPTLLDAPIAESLDKAAGTRPAPPPPRQLSYLGRAATLRDHAGHVK